MSPWLTPRVSRKLQANVSPKSRANSTTSSIKFPNPYKKIHINKASSIPKEFPSPEGRKATKMKAMYKTSKPTSVKLSNKLPKLTKSSPSCTKIFLTRVNRSKFLTFPAPLMLAKNSKNMKPSSTVNTTQDLFRPKWTLRRFKEMTKTQLKL